ncbi:hypothetical protein [Rubinisphaera brasiliensis]|uniref:Uncharacterized protein n=1 Tax=Rubinisphaera brasiliensis (strain ATCC 49424 / DSM 5305 / JCM 21570 / IAM 15109 / NBRC 103401 / IFAM 1448) TaxID=756272 RepID=F0SM24_RUBBR|nr:hypothetical protein [Rubinisphaera brasiliensis]ADY60979.1 hypothetical protein Plabr_3382 [Rubinisphaera brasiliensis DSM 5305]
MKRTVPLLIAAICGTVLIITAFIPATVSWGETAAVWFDVLAAIAFVLGGGNLLKVHLKKVSDRGPGWAYSAITVLTFLATLTVGLLKWGVPPASDQEFYGYTFAHLAIDELPEELDYEVSVSLPSEYSEREIPASVRSQLEYQFGEDGSINELHFSGWITPGQLNDLSNLYDSLEWKCAIEQLGEAAAIPSEFAGKVAYFADHASLSAYGLLEPSLAEDLKSISASAPWTRAIEELAERTSRTETFQLEQLPKGIAIPDDFSSALKIEGDTLTVTGPLTPDMKAVLQDQFPRIRPSNDEEVESFLAELESRDGPIDENDRNLVRGLLESSWQTDQLVAVLNDAGKRPAVPKSYCELLQERQAGETMLLRTVPAAEEDVQLNDEQVAAIQEAVSNPEQDLTELGAELVGLGPWIPAQEAALQSFLSRVPTLAEQKRLIATAMTSPERKLTPEQASFLLGDFAASHRWNEEVYDVFLATHRVKYPWSGGYLQNGSPFWWSYEYAFRPLTATMFALLAFYVASAAFRAFRAKNFEAFLLLATAFIILLGRTPAGVALTAGLPDELAMLKVENITVFIMSVINTAGNRAIMIGIALGIVSTSLKILLGVDRSYLGTGEG